MVPSVLVSLCLLGIECRYDGKGNGIPGIDALRERCHIIPVCPEQLSGLPTPRVPAERLGNRVITRDGADVTAAFERGAAHVCRLAEIFGARYALMKARSPSCGCGAIYDGSFTGSLVPGDGATVERLRAMGIRCYTEAQMDELLRALGGDER